VGFIPDVMLLRVQRAWAPMNGGCRRWRWRQTLQETSKIGSGDPQFPGAGRAGTVAAALADGGSRVLVDQCRSRHNHKQIREIACLFLLNGKNQSQHAHPAMWGGAAVPCPPRQHWTLTTVAPALATACVPPPPKAQ
jgi:hypothetical protein